MANYPSRKEYQISTAASWASLNPVVGEGVLCVEQDTGVVKVGDGTSPYNSLPSVGEQTSVVGITGSREEFNTAVTDGTIIFLEDFPDTDPGDGVTIWNDEGVLKVSVV